MANRETKRLRGLRADADAEADVPGTCRPASYQRPMARYSSFSQNICYDDLNLRAVVSCMPEERR
jgi:hypothetical protein